MIYNLKYCRIAFLTSLSFLVFSCGIYSFTGADTGNAETFQVNFFQITAPVVEPGIDRTFTLALQDLIQNQTNLSIVNSNGDLIYEGEITQYFISPMTATSNELAAQDRLTIAVNVRYFNTSSPVDSSKNFTQIGNPKKGKSALILLSQSGETKDLYRCLTSPPS